MIKIIFASVSIALLVGAVLYINPFNKSSEFEKEIFTEIENEHISTASTSESTPSLSVQNQKPLADSDTSISTSASPVEVPVAKEVSTTPPEPPVTQLQELPSAEAATPEIKQSKTKGTCVYNHAYQENYQNDSISKILKEAEGCYVLIDPFEDNAHKNISAIKMQDNIVGCYISVGTGEDWRDDFKTLKPFLAKKAWEQWEGEYFISKISPELIDIMQARIATLSAWGCDYVEFDNMDWAFDDDNRDEYNLEVTALEAQTYNQTLCSYVHEKGMKCMAKNTRKGATMFDGGTYESYPNEKDWWDTIGLQSFLQEGKLGIIVHYNEKNCDNIYKQYQNTYGKTLSFICEDKKLKKYTHY